MKKLLIAALVAGAAGAALILYLTYEPRSSRDVNNIADAAADAYRTMNKGIGSVERGTEKVFDAL